MFDNKSSKQVITWSGITHGLGSTTVDCWLSSHHVPTNTPYPTPSSVSPRPRLCSSFLGKVSLSPHANCRPTPRCRLTHMLTMSSDKLVVIHRHVNPQRSSEANSCRSPLLSLTGTPRRGPEQVISTHHDRIDDTLWPLYLIGYISSSYHVRGINQGTRLGETFRRYGYKGLVHWHPQEQ